MRSPPSVRWPIPVTLQRPSAGASRDTSRQARGHLWARAAIRASAAARLQLRQVVPGGVPSDLVPQVSLQYGYFELILTEQGQPVSGFNAQEVRQAILADAFSTGGLQEDAVDVGEALKVFAEHGPGQYIPPGTVGARAVQVGHLGQHAGRRAREQRGQGRNGLRRAVGGGAAELPVIDEERRRQTQQRFRWQEVGLPGTRHPADDAASPGTPVAPGRPSDPGNFRGRPRRESTPRRPTSWPP